MKMLVGPYRDRFFGRLPIMYQLYLLQNIKRIAKTASQYNTLPLWLTTHKVRIIRETRLYNSVTIMQQMKLMEGICEQEFHPSGFTNEQITKANSKDGTGRAVGLLNAPPK